MTKNSHFDVKMYGCGKAETKKKNLFIYLCLINNFIIYITMPYLSDYFIDFIIFQYNKNI